LPLSAEEFYNNFQVMSRPVVIYVPGGLESIGWNTNKWTEEYLNEKVGDISVHVEKKIQGEPFGRMSEKTTVEFKEFLSHTYHTNFSVPGNDLYYLNLQFGFQSGILKPPLSKLTEDWIVPGFFLSRATYAANLWIGASDPNSGATSGLHHDEGDNLYILIKGRKNVRLFSPADSFNVYPVGTILGISPTGRHHFCGNPESHWSSIDFNRPEEIKENFPRFSDAVSMECEVSEGEMLFIPNGWWHQVTSYGIHIAINLWTVAE